VYAAHAGYQLARAKRADRARYFSRLGRQGTQRRTAVDLVSQ
jgi:hypothetical protein